MTASQAAATLMTSRCLRLAVLTVVLGVGVDSRGQTATEPVPGRPAIPDELNQAELLKSYLQVREQLHAAQLAIVNNRVEAESAARAQAAAIAEKLDAIRAAMTEDRERQLRESERLEEERRRRLEEEARTNRTTIWLAAVLAGAGLAAVGGAAIFQWRAVRRVAAVAALLPERAGQSPALLESHGGQGALGPGVETSNRRLLAVIDRLEQRVKELEHTAVPGLPPTMGAPVAAEGVAPVRDRAGVDARRAEPAEESRTVTADDAGLTLLLNKAGFLLGMNRLKEAVACYDEVLKIDLRHPEALVKKGTALERLQRDDEAIRCYDRAIEADEGLVVAYLHKGGLCNRLGRFDEALACYERALRVEEKRT
jgi:tetratricopeptide (TPR) repeat protein